MNADPAYAHPGDITWTQSPNIYTGGLTVSSGTSTAMNTASGMNIISGTAGTAMTYTGGALSAALANAVFPVKT